jgi:hypothetical protein
MSKQLEIDLARATAVDVSQVKEHYNDEFYLTVLIDHGDGYEVCSYTADESREDGWELSNNTGVLDTWSEAFTNYGWHLDLYYGLTYKEAHPNKKEAE